MNEMKRLLSFVRRAVDDYNMIEDGDRIAVGISGGKDSSIAAALCARALGKDRVIGVLMPQGEQHDIDMAHMLVDHLGIKHFIVNIKDSSVLNVIAVNDLYFFVLLSYT